MTWVSIIASGFRPSAGGSERFYKTLAYSHQNEFRIALSPRSAFRIRSELTTSLAPVACGEQVEKANRVPLRVNLVPAKP